MGMKFSIEVEPREKSVFLEICRAQGAHVSNVSACYDRIYIEIYTDAVTASLIDFEFSKAIGEV